MWLVNSVYILRVAMIRIPYLPSCMQAMLAAWKRKEPDMVSLFHSSYGPDATYPHLYNWGKADAGPGVPNHDNGLEGYNPTIKKALEKKKRVITEAIPIFLSHTTHMSVASEKKGFVDQPQVPNKERFTLWKQANALSKGDASYWITFLKKTEYRGVYNNVTMIFMPTFAKTKQICSENRLDPKVCLLPAATAADVVLALCRRRASIWRNSP